MRNPIRPKNLRLRFLPLYLVGLAILVLQPPRPEHMLAALALIGFGAALRGWGAGHLVKNDRLTTTGPYAHLRHPLYLGTLLVATGFIVWVGGRWVPLGLAALWGWFALHYLPRKERVESARLLSAYGDRYARYRAAVPALWPRLQRWRDDATGDGAARDRWRLARFDDNNELGTLLALSLVVLVFWLRGGAGAFG